MRGAGAGLIVGRLGRELHRRIRYTNQLFIVLPQNSMTAGGVIAAQARRLCQQFQAVGFVQRRMETAHDLREVALRPLLSAFMAPDPFLAGYLTQR